MRERLGFSHTDVDPALNQLAEIILAAARTVRSELGAGLLEEMYRLALLHELRSRGLEVRTRVPLEVVYKGLPLGKGYEADLIVEGRITVELTACEAIHPAHEAQLLTYMRLARTPLGFLINFDAVPLHTGIRRKVLSNVAPSA